MTFQDPEKAFTEAIEQGRLSDDGTSPLWAGCYMYMGHEGEQAMFKHIISRKYLPSA